MSGQDQQVHRPVRLHHQAFVCRDLAETRRFYEDVLGFPLVATWCEEEDFAGERMAYCHTFFELADGSCLAFFRFADPVHQGRLAQHGPFSPFIHLALKVDAATQDAIRQRLETAGHGAALMHHGYVRSLYVTDPNGLNLEFTLDHPDAERIHRVRSASARADLERWIAGDHATNNVWREEAHSGTGW